MDLLIILKCKILIFVNRIKKMSLKDRSKLIALIATLILGLFIISFNALNKFKAIINPELFIFVLCAITIFSIPFGIRKSYDTYFYSSDNSLLYTAPITTNTVLLFKHLMISLRLSIPYIIVWIPTAISFGIIQKYNMLYYIIIILALITYILLVSNMLQIITLFLHITIKTAYKGEIIYFISRALNIALLVIFNLVVFNRKNFDVIGFVNAHVFIDLQIIRNILLSLYVNSINITACFSLLILALIIFSINMVMFKIMFAKGIFTDSYSIKSNTSKNHRMSNLNKFFIKLFPKNNVLIYKDIIIFIRTLKSWDLILTPLIYSIILFLLGYKRDPYMQIFQYSMFISLWISTNLVFNAIRSEGMMLDTIKNSTFNLKNIIFSKVCYVVILSIPVLIFLSILVLIFFKLSLFQWILAIAISCISVITSGVLGIPYILYNSNLEDKKVLFSPNVEGKLYLKLTVIFVPLYYTFKWIIKSNLNMQIRYILALLLVIAVCTIVRILSIKAYKKFESNI